MEDALSVRLLCGPYLDVVLGSSLFLFCQWPFVCSIVLPLLLALLLFAGSNQDITMSRRFTSHKTTNGFIITPNFASLSRKFTKPLSFVKLEPLATLVFNFTRS